MNHSHVRTRSLTGPLVLIAVGSLFLIQNLTSMDVFRVLWRYWPVILIAMGVSKLLEHFRGSGSFSR